MLFKFVDIPDNMFRIFETYKRVVLSGRDKGCYIMPNCPCRAMPNYPYAGPNYSCGGAVFI
jgi:hypothetical protein